MDAGFVCNTSLPTTGWARPTSMPLLRATNVLRCLSAGRCTR